MNSYVLVYHCGGDMGSGADFRAQQQLGPQDLHLFVINGISHSGKDEIVKHIISEMYEQYCWRGVLISSVDEVKAAAITLGWDEIRDETGRLFLSTLKDLSTKFYNGPMKYMRNRILQFQKLNRGGVIFLMIREPEEISKFVTEFPKTKTIYMQRDGMHVYGNHADQNVANYSYDITIYNNGSLEELREKAKLFASQLAKGELLQSEY